MSENYESMTVLELRRVAKEMGVTLGGGISKQGIVEKLRAASAKNEDTAQAPAPAPKIEEAEASPAPQQTRIRSASIIADDENDWSDADDIPVLTPNAPRVPVRPPMTPVAQPAAAPAPASSAPAAQSAARPSSLSTISSKAPAFTMEGVRAWHNPRAFTSGGYQNPAYQAPGYVPQTQPRTWQRPAPVAPVSPSAAPAAPTAPRADLRPATRPLQKPYTPPQRFGPAETPAAQTAENVQDYRPGLPTQDYRPAPAQTAYEPRVSDYPAQDYKPMASTRPGELNYPRDPYAPRDTAQKPSLPELLAGSECRDGAGVLETHPDGFGFLRAENFLPGHSDVYVSNAQIRRFKLRTGDYIEGKTRPQREGDRYSALLYITKVNDVPVDDLGDRPVFEELTAIYPKKRMTLAPKAGGEAALRELDMLSPLGFGQRTLLTVPVGADKSALLTLLTDAVSQRHPSAKLMLLLVDERPEEVTLLRERVKGEVLFANIDESPENQIRVSELVLERAMRLTEQKRDAVVIIDNMTRLARAYNMVAPSGARILPCGVAAPTLSRLNRIFGAARMTREGGSLTVIALASTGVENPIADFVIEEFRASLNSLWALKNAGKEKVKFNLTACFTMRDDLQLTAKEQELATKIREIMERGQSGADAVSELFSQTDSEDALEEKVNEYLGNH